MSLANTLAGGETDPAAFDMGGGGQALKGAENLLFLRIVEANPIVPDGQPPLFGVKLNMDDRRPLRRSIFKCVANQILEQLVQE